MDTQPSSSPNTPPIYLSVWYFNDRLRRGVLRFEALPEWVRAHGFDGVEIMDRQLPNRKPAFLADFGKRCREVDCGVVLDCSSDLTHSEDGAWRAQIEYVEQSLTAAQLLGAHQMRILLGGQAWSFQKLFSRTRVRSSGGRSRGAVGAVLQRLVSSRWLARLAHAVRKRRPARVAQEERKIGRAVAALEQILPAAEAEHLPLVIENHWGISSRPENILRVVEHFDSPWLGTCPDFDNFPNEVDRYEALRRLAPRAQLVHAKSRTFNGRGEERHIDYRRCLRILRESGYAGTVTVEYDGPGDALAGCVRTRELILKHWPAQSVHLNNA